MGGSDFGLQASDGAAKVAEAYFEGGRRRRYLDEACEEELVRS